ncbi:hypothetical protein IT400_03910 [Candidatus Nomurabacteria bacterium]|nr:hypothetical protein [Candidatus Nomurabacteria bacterium]
MAYHELVEWKVDDVLYRPQGTRYTRDSDEYQIKEALITEGFVDWNVEEILPPAFLAYCRKCVLPPKRLEWQNQPQKSFCFSSLTVAKWFGEKSRLQYAWNNILKLGKWAIWGPDTSQGKIFLLHPNLLLCLQQEGWENGKKEISRSTHSVRQVGGFNVCQVGKTWFVWSGDFANHIEGTGNLKSIIELAERRKKKDSLILTLNDVRNDRSGTAGFCLYGIKCFLQVRMPHVYNLVKDYNSWSEIPEEIMAIEWPLVSKKIFRGYPSPVN